jgi:hypothetical protein
MLTGLIGGTLKTFPGSRNNICCMCAGPQKIARAEGMIVRARANETLYFAVGV